MITALDEILLGDRGPGVPSIEHGVLVIRGMKHDELAARAARRPYVRVEH